MDLVGQSLIEGRCPSPFIGEQFGTAERRLRDVSAGPLGPPYGDQAPDGLHDTEGHAPLAKP